MEKIYAFKGKPGRVNPDGNNSYNKVIRDQDSQIQKFDLEIEIFDNTHPARENSKEFQPVYRIKPPTSSLRHSLIVQPQNHLMRLIVN